MFRSRLAALAPLSLAALSLAFAAPVHAQQQADPTLNAQNADIRAFIQDVSRVTGRTFVIDPAVQGQVTIASGGALTEDQMYEVFLSTLRAHGYVVIPTASGAFRIAPDDDAARQPSAPGGERYVTQVIRLNTRDAASVVPILEELVGTGGQVSAAPRTNAIVITDYADNVSRLSRLVRDLDRDTDTIDILPLTNSRASVLAAALREITGAGTGPEGQPGSSYSAANFTAVDSSNSLVIRGPAETVSRLRAIAVTLDNQARPTGDTRVIFLQHTDAVDIANLLQIVLDQPRLNVGGAAPQMSPGEAAVAQPYSSAASGAQRGVVAPFIEANAIVVRADPTIQQEIEAIVRQLDRRSEQVQVQAIVVEISDDAARDLGVQFMLSGTDNSSLPFFATSYSNAQPNILALSTALIGSNNLPEDSGIIDDLQGIAVDSLLSATGGILGGGGQSGDTLFGAILNLVKRDSGSNLLSTPSLMTLNNREAHILVGQEVPISTGEVLSSDFNNPFRTIDRKEIGIRLTVTPQINAQGSITMDIKQEVSSIAPGSAFTGGEFIFNKREIDTSVIVDDGEIVVLGGLLEQNEAVSVEKIPGLGDIPGLGRLFSSESTSRYQTNLVVFLRPVIVRDAIGARAVTQPSIDRFRGLQVPGPLEHVPFDNIVPNTDVQPLPYSLNEPDPNNPNSDVADIQTQPAPATLPPVDGGS